MKKKKKFLKVIELTVVSSGTNGANSVRNGEGILVISCFFN